MSELSASHRTYRSQSKFKYSLPKKKTGRKKNKEQLRVKSNESFLTVYHSLIALDIFAQFDFDDLFSRVMNILFTIIQPWWSMPIFTDFNKSFSHPQFHLTCVSLLRHALLLDTHIRLSINQCIYFVEELTILHIMHSTSLLELSVLINFLSRFMCVSRHCSLFSHRDITLDAFI